MTIDEQVENLKSIGLIVDDDKYAKKYSMIFHILGW